MYPFVLMRQPHSSIFGNSCRLVLSSYNHLYPSLPILVVKSNIFLYFFSASDRLLLFAIILGIEFRLIAYGDIFFGKFSFYNLKRNGKLTCFFIVSTYLSFSSSPSKLTPVSLSPTTIVILLLVPSG